MKIKNIEKQHIEKRTLGIVEAGKLLGLGKNAAYRAVHKKQIPSIRIGGRILVPRVLFDRMLEQAK